MEKNKKKVLFVATVDSHIELFHLPYLKMFKDKSYEVHVATNTDKKIEYCDKKHKISIERNPFKLKNLKAIRELRKIVDAEKFDIIHCHTPMGGVVARLAAKKARKNGTRMIYTAHGFHFYTGAPLKNWLLFYPVEKYLAKYTDTLITINTEDFERAKNKFWKRCKDIQYVPGVGVDEKKFSKKLTAKQKHDLRKSLGLKDDDFVMICVGRLDVNKNQSALIRETKKLVEKNKKYHLILVGRDELNGKNQKLARDLGISENIHFTGYRDDINELMQVSDIAVSASKREGLGLNLIEALCCGTPIIALDNRGHRDIVKECRNGLIVLENEFAEAIYHSKYKDANSNKHSISEVFTLKNVHKKMDNIYFRPYKNAVFIHDVRMKRHGEKYYTDTNLNKAVFDKYLKYFDNITIISRKEPVTNKELKKYALVSGEHLDFDCIDKLSVKNLGHIRKVIRQNVLRNDFAIIRLPSIFGLIACHECNKYHVPYMVEMVGDSFAALWYYGKLRYKVLAPIIYILNRHFVKKSQNVMYVTQKYLQKLYPNKNTNIGITDANIIPCDEAILRKRIEKVGSMKNKTIKIGLVGSMNVKYKGHLCAIRTVKELSSRGIECEMHFLGQCSDENRKKWFDIASSYGIEDKIFYDGTLPSGQPVMDWIDNLDFFIMPSALEGLPRTMIEAMSRGLICFGSKVGGIPELIDEKCLFDKNDYKGFGSAIEKYLNDETAAVNMINRNYKKALEYTQENNDFMKKTFMCDMLKMDIDSK